MFQPESVQQNSFSSGGDLFAVLFPFTILDLLLIYLVVKAFRLLYSVLRLTKHGERTTGTVIQLIAGKGNAYIVRYHVDSQDYICIGNRLTDKGKCGEKMTV